MQPVVEQNLFKGYSTNMGWCFVSLNETMLECFKLNRIRLNRPNQQKATRFALTSCMWPVMEQKSFKECNTNIDQSLVSLNRIMLKCFRLNEVYLNRSIQQKVSVF